MYNTALRNTEVLVVFGDVFGRVMGRRATRWSVSARARNHRFGRYATRAHTKGPHETDLLWNTLRRFTAPGGPGPSDAIQLRLQLRETDAFVAVRM